LLRPTDAREKQESEVVLITKVKRGSELTGVFKEQVPVVPVRDVEIPIAPVVPVGPVGPAIPDGPVGPVGPVRVIFL